MGNYNPNYFDRKSSSLEEAIRNAVNGVRTQIDEKVSYVEYKFKNKQDAMKAKLFYDGLQRMGFEVNDDNINGGELMVDAGKNDMTQYHKQIMQKYKPKVMTQEKMDAVGKEDGDIDNDGDKDASDKYLAKRRKAVSKAIKSDQKENFIGTPENTKAKLDATPGQSSDEWNQQVEIMQKKNTSMREALAKVWGFDEGKNPFEKEENVKAKKEDKTLTGKPMTKVSVDPDMKEKKN
jgi:hypothetical protein